jgi:Ca2+-binding RTX toxin-like protein
MGGRFELRGLVFFGFLLAALATGLVARGGEDVRAAENPVPASALLPDSDEISATLAAGHENYLADLARREEELASPQAVAERLRSREAYVGLGAAEAQQLAFSAFASTFEELGQDPARFLSDARLDRVVEADAATVTSEGNTQLLEAGMPVQTEDEEGELAKVDLDVVPDEDGWELENPLVGVEVGASVEEGVTLPEAGVTVVQVGAEDSAARPEGDSDLFFPEIEEGTDTDLIVSPTSTGVELFDVLRSPASPETFRFQLQLPTGAELRPGPAGSAEVVVDGEVSIYVPRPWAHDAQGTAIPVEMTVEDNALVLAVAHRDQDLAYPILVDPTIYQDWGWWYAGQNLQGLSAFYFQTSPGGWWAHGTYADPGGFPGYDNKGLFVWSDPGNLGSDQWGQWVRPAPNAGSYLAAATINPFWRQDNPCNDPTRDYQPYDYQGMWNGEGGVGWNELRFNDAKNYGYTSLPTWGRSLIFGLSTDWRGRESPCYRHLMAGGIGIWLDDWQNPTVSITALPAGWIKKDGTARSLSVSAGDGGLGVQSVTMTSPFSAGWNQPWCAGTYDNPCSGSRSGTIGFTTSGLAEGPVGVAVQVSDPTAKNGSTSGTIYVDGSVPTLGLSGSSTATTYELQIDAKDGGPGEQRSGVKEVKVYLDGQLKQTKTGSCSTSGCGATLSFKYSQSLVGLSQGTHTVEVVATDQVGYTKSGQSKFTVEAPNTVIDSGPEGLSKEATPKFTYHSTQEGSTFKCRVDAGAWVSCPAVGYTTAKLAEGPHTFEVKATNGAGLEDQTPAKREFNILGPPETTIVFGPKGATSAKRPTFGYQSNNPQAWFECKLDAGSYVPCGPATYETLEGHPGQVLAEGAHSVSVRAVNQLEVADPTPAVASFTVDATAPKAEVTSGPEGPTSEVRPTFNFNASGTIACFLEAEGEPETEEGEPPFGPCTTTSSYTPPSNLPEGSYEFHLRARDAALNETEDVRAFSVDTTAPDTAINSAPAAITDDATPTIEFSSSEAESTFQCRYDAEAFRACLGPAGTDTPATALAAGAHTFQVRAVDGAGNADATPATAAFTLVTAGPQTTINSGPEGAIGGTEAAFTYSTDETASMECRLDGASFSSCATTGKTYTGLAEGEHVFEVRGKATVADPTPARRTFVVDTSAPSTPTLSGPIFEEDGYGLHFRVEASDGDPTTPQSRRSGVESVQILLAGEVVMELGAECTAKVCPANFVRDAQIPWEPLLASPAGASVQARVKDGLGHISTASLEVKQPHEQAVEATDGSGSGAFSLLAAGCPSQVETKGTRMIGTCGNDTLVPSKEITVVEALDGEDVIIGNSKTKTIKGGGGADVIRGGGGNDVLRGEDGADHIYGGNGDDELWGEDDGDVLDGGPGEDPLRGGKANDTLRGGQGPDTFFGGPGTDTASFADALAPGFAEAEASNDSATSGRPNLYASAKQKAMASSINSFPPPAEAGVYIRFAQGSSGPVAASAGDPTQGGGTDTLKENERIVGSPFGDWIEGAVASTIDPGPGEDMVFNAGGGLQKGAEDWVDGQRAAYNPPAKPIVGSYQAGLETNVYVIGGGANENLSAKLSDNQVRVTGAVSKALQVGKNNLGALVIYGGVGDDVTRMSGENKKRPGAVLLSGGPGSDQLFGGPMEELIVDGIQQNSGTAERLFGGGGEDDLAQSEGADKVEGGPDNDLFLNSRICEGDSFYAFDAGFKTDSEATKKAAKEAEDNAQFHLLPDYGVYANMQKEKLGGFGNNLNAQYALNCGAQGGPETFKHFNAFEGSPQNDLIRGNGNHNYILGRGGENKLYGGGGPDTLLVNNKHPELVVDCGGGSGDGDIAKADPKWDIHYSPPAKKMKATCRVVSEEGRYSDGQDPGPVNQDRKLYPVGGGGGKAAAASTAALSGGSTGTSTMAALAGEGEEAAYPTAEFHLDETTGTNAANALDEEAPATYMAKGTGPSVGGPGPVLGGESALLGEEGEEGGSSISLDGSTAYVNLNGQAGPEGGEGYSVSVYVKFAAPAGKTEYLFSSAGTGGRGAFLYRAPNGSIVFTTGQLFGAPAVASEPIPAGDWHQVVASLEGETISLNVDGFPYELDYHSDVMPAPALSPESLLGAGPGATDLLAGRLDEFTSYEGVLSDGEIFPMLAASRAQIAGYLPASPAEGDEDADGVADGLDNCPANSNPDQVDSNLDGVGDACQVADQDEDGVDDASDNCPTIYNPEQTDTDENGVGDDCSSLSPEVETGEATAVKATTATIGGTVNPEGSTTSYYFEYGPTTAYGTKIPVSPKAVGTGFSSVAVSQALTGLAQGTTYHYRLVATNSAGTETGFDQTFLTLKAPKATTLSAADIGQKSATLNGTVNPEGSTTSYYFEYGPTTAYGTKIPVSPKEVGAGTSAVAVSQALTGLAQGATYHYRLVATSVAATTNGVDQVFTTQASSPVASQLGAMALTDPFNATTNAVSNFSTKWSALGWAGGTPAKGENRTTGWSAVSAWPTINGAYYAPTVADVGTGVATVATVAAGPGNNFPSRYFALWLDLQTPGSARSGYQLRFVQTSLNVYEVILAKWSAGTETVLATKTGYSLAAGSSIALVDEGSDVAAWTNTGAGFTQILTAADSSFSGGNGGVEASGNGSRLTNFKIGQLLSSVANMSAALGALRLDDAFAITELPLSGGGAWAALSWDYPSANRTGRVVAGEGWGPYDPWEFGEAINGAYWTKATFADAGSGDAVAATLKVRPGLAGRHFELLLNMPNPAAARSGYELRFAEPSAGTGVYTVTLVKWTTGTPTTLASQTGVSLAIGGRFGLVDKAGVLSAWIAGATGEFTQLFSASDTTYQSGYVGIAGGGNFARLANFRGSQLPPF